MASSNIKLFDENKGNMLSDSEFSISNQRMNGLQTGVASSQLQNKAMYQVSLVAYAIAQVMMQNGLNANDTDAVSTFVSNLSRTMLQKVYDIATTEEAQAGKATGKWMSPALVKAAIDTLAAKAQNILSDETKALYGLGADATPDDVLNRIHTLFTKSGIPVAVKVVDTNGNAAPEGIRISGLYTIGGDNASTGPDGVAYGSMMENGSTLSVDTYLDLNGSVSVISSSPDEFAQATLVATLVDFKRIDDSISGRISPWCTRLDVSAIGGGGGGFQLTQNGDRTHRGGGGKAGAGIAVKNVLFFPNIAYDIVIGAGGAVLKNGGATTLFGLTAAGGRAGVNNDTEYTGGDFELYASLTTTETVGGHGGCGVYSTDSSAVAVHGSPYGGYGAVCIRYKTSNYKETTSTAATGPGGGGGGNVANGWTTPGTRASAGYKGAAALRMWH